MLIITLITLLGLSFGDLLGLIIFYLCREFSDKPQKKSQKNIVWQYYDFWISILKERKKALLLQYFLLYLITLVLTFLSYNHFGITIKFIFALIFCYGLIILTFVDARTQYLPDIITKPLIIFGLIQGYFEIFTDLRTAVTGAIAGYLLLWTINTLFRLIRKKEGMGYGDFKLLSAIAAWVGATQIPLVIIFSSLIGIFVAAILAILPDNKFNQPNPFGPALAIAGVTSLFWGEQIISWYISLFI